MRHLVEKLLDTTPAMQWVKGEKRKQLIARFCTSDNETVYHAVRVLENISAVPQFRGSDLSVAFLVQANLIAENLPIDTKPGHTVMFSGKSQAEAEEFVNDNPEYDVIHTTVPGALLEMFQLFHDDWGFTREQQYGPWNTLSNRLAHQASGNLTFFVTEPKATSTLITDEMGILLANDNVTTINNGDKFVFWQNLGISKLPDGADMNKYKHEICKKHCKHGSNCPALCFNAG